MLDLQSREGQGFLLLLLPRMCSLPRRKKLIEFDFSIVVGGAIKDEAATIGVAEDEVVAKGGMTARKPKIIQAAK